MAKILIIDDDQGLTTIFKAALERAQHEVLLAQTGEEGIRTAKTEQPQLILLDFILPDVDGHEVLKRLKADEQTKAIPVAILSNFGQKDKIKSTLSEGASEFILKYQIGTEDLVEKVKGLLRYGSSTL